MTYSSHSQFTLGSRALLLVWDPYHNDTQLELRAPWRPISGYYSAVLTTPRPLLSYSQVSRGSNQCNTFCASDTLLPNGWRPPPPSTIDRPTVLVVSCDLFFPRCSHSSYACHGVLITRRWSSITVFASARPDDDAFRKGLVYRRW